MERKTRKQQKRGYKKYTLSLHDALPISPLYVEILDDDSILAVKEVIDKLMAGEVISEPRVTDLQQIYEVDESDLEGDYYVNNHADDDEYDDFYWEHGGYLDESDYETFVHPETEEDYYE